MNEKQAKLLRYFVKNTGKAQLQMAAAFKMGWPTLNHKKKGKLTKWLKEAIVTGMAVKKQMQEDQIKHNIDVLKGFSL